MKKFISSCLVIVMILSVVMIPSFTMVSASTENMIWQQDFDDGTYSGIVGQGSPSLAVVDGQEVQATGKVLKATKASGAFWLTHTTAASAKTGIQYFEEDFYIPQGAISGSTEHLVFIPNYTDGAAAVKPSVEFSDGNGGESFTGGILIEDYPRDSWFTLRYKFNYETNYLYISILHDGKQSVIASMSIAKLSFVTHADGGIRNYRIGGTAVDGITFYNDNIKIYTGTDDGASETPTPAPTSDVPTPMPTAEPTEPAGKSDAESVIMQMDFNGGAYTGVTGAGNPSMTVVDGDSLGTDNKALQVSKTGGAFWTVYTPATSYKTGIQHMTADFYIPTGEITGTEHLLTAINHTDAASCTRFWVEFSEGNNGKPVAGYGTLVTDYPRDSWFTLHYKFNYYRKICEISLIHNGESRELYNGSMENTTLVTHGTGGLRAFRIGGVVEDITFYNDNVRIYEDIYTNPGGDSETPVVSTMLALDYEAYETGKQAPAYGTLRYSPADETAATRAHVVIDPEDKHNQALMLQSDGYGATTAYWQYGTFSGKNVFTARVRTDDEINYKAIVLRGTSNLPNLLEMRGGRLLSMGVDIGKCESGKWYNFAALFDNDERAVSIYLDGKPVRYMKLGTAYDGVVLNRLDFSAVGWYGNRATLYVDDIYHYKFANSSTGAIVSLLHEKQGASSIKLAFTNEMQADTINAETVKISGVTDYAVSYDNNKTYPRTASIYFKTPLTKGAEYEISFANVLDIFGNELKTEPISFTVTDETMPVADFIKALLDALGVSYDDEIAKAVEMGIVEEGEIADKTLPITRGQAASMAIRGISEEYYNDMSAFIAKISDYSSIDEKYRDDAVKAYSEGIIELYANGLFAADTEISASEAADIISKAANPDKRTIPLKPEAKFSLPSVFGDGMVLQRGETIAVYGMGKEGETVRVAMGDASASAVVSGGKWKANLPGVPAGGPYTLTVSGSEKADTIVYNNVLVGEVWLVSGQSNAALMTNKALTWEEDSKALDNPNLRVFTQSVRPTTSELPDTTGTWFTPNTTSIGEFSAVGYYFAEKLQRELGVPVGMINASKGGSYIDPWMPEGTVPEGVGTELENQYYNGMISALTDFGISGVVWYQGESNATAAFKELYEDALYALITGWRAKWQKELSFLIVQLPPYELTNFPMYHYIRESGLNVAKRLPGVGMAATSDIPLGGTDPLHPTNKKPVGERLALLARGMNYGYEDEYSMPLYQNITIEGNKAIVHFSHTGTGLSADGELVGFKICGADKNFVDAKAEIVGDTVHVYSDEVQNPVAVRYFFDPVTDKINLYNSAGLPASPFRSDYALDCYTVSITDANGTELNELHAGMDVIAQISLTNNNSQKGKNGVFVTVAEYSADGLRMVHAASAYADIAGGEIKNISVPFTVNGSGGLFKVFIWENSVTLKPIRAIQLNF